MANRWGLPERNIEGPDGEKLGYWASRWVEFKRLFVQMAWENDTSRAIFTVGPVVLFVLLFGVIFLGWR